MAATHNVRPERVDRFRTQYPAPFASNPEFVTTVREGIFHLADIEHNPDATPEQIEFARLAGYRTRLMAPMMRGDSLLGIIAVTREAPAPFSGEQVKLLRTFADQAVMAIENVRLFKELEEKNQALTQAHAQVSEALEQQTATGEILRVISASTTDVQPVFETIVRSATRLCNARDASLVRFDGALVHLAATTAVEPERLAALRSQFPMPPTRTLALCRAIVDDTVVHIPDVVKAPEYPQDHARRVGLASILVVPMLREGIPVGAVGVSRSVPEPFSETQVALLPTFADQAVIAIENVRLLTDLQARTRES